MSLKLAFLQRALLKRSSCSLVVGVIESLDSCISFSILHMVDKSLELGIQLKFKLPFHLFFSLKFLGHFKQV